MTKEERNQVIEECAKIAEDISRVSASQTTEREMAYRLCPRVAANIRALKE